MPSGDGHGSNHHCGLTLFCLQDPNRTATLQLPTLYEEWFQPSQDDHFMFDPGIQPCERKKKTSRDRIFLKIHDIRHVSVLFLMFVPKQSEILFQKTGRPIKIVASTARLYVKKPH